MSYPPSYGQQQQYPQGYPQGQPIHPGHPQSPPGYPQGQPAPGYPQGQPAPGYPQGQPAPGYPQGEPAPGYPQGQQGYQEGQPGYHQGPQGPPGGMGGIGAMAGMRGMVRGLDKNDDDVEGGEGSFGSKAIRQAFIRKVFIILFCQLLVTFAVVCFFKFHEPTRNFVRQNKVVYYISYGIFFVTYMALVCCPSVRRSYPGNFIALGVFTLAFSYVTGTITSYYDTEVVLIAAGITAGVCLALTLFAWQTKIDFTLCSGLIFVVSIVLLLFGVAVMIVSIVSGPNKILNIVYGAVAALVFSLYLVYDVQMLIGNKKHSLSEEEYIYGALQLYMDIVNLFLIILSLVGAAND